MKKIIISTICLVWLISGVGAQEVTYDIISTTGKIVDKRSGKELQVGDRVVMQTELEFNSLNDRAVVLDPSKTKYFVELPKSSFVNSQLTVTSNQALAPVKSRPALITGVRGNSVLVTKGLSPKSLKEYFEIDTFTVVGAKFTLPVSRQDARKYDLVLRYEKGNIVEQSVLTDLTIAKTDLKIEGNRISECYVLLKDGEKLIPVTQLSLFFVDKPQLFGEFRSLLKALNQPKSDKKKVRELLRQYCTDVYGMIDRNVLEDTINDYLALK